MLSPELISLVHHIELNKAGWWDLALQRLILTALWVKRDKITLNSEEVRATLADYFSISLDEPVVNKHLHGLATGGQLLVFTEGRYKLSEHTIRQCEEDLTDSAQLEGRVRVRFQTLLSEYCPSLDFGPAWNSYHEKFLLPMVSEMGANTYRLITGANVGVEMPQLRPFTDSFEPSETIGLRELARVFLNPTDPDVRRYVLRTMNAYFVVRAGGLNDHTIEKLARSAAKLPAAVLFLDTNVLFSLLGLHENPADEGSMALISLVRRLSASIPIRLRVLPHTLDEMRRAITASQEAVINMRISPQLLNSVANAGISGITEKFLRLSAGRDKTVSPADYFKPYLHNLLTILRGNGVDLFSQDLAAYKTRQDVIDDLLQQQEFENKKFGDRAKNYERLEHDMVLWHFANDKRPVQVESPIDANCWVVTADYRLLGFDAHKQRQMSAVVPICLHPATLTQLLQFWMPQTPEFEEALLSTMRLPAVLTVVDSDTERVSLKILNALSSFENIGNLPTETTTRILLNDALRQKLRVEDDVAKQVNLVREALVEENKKTEEQLDEEKLKGSQLQQARETLQTQLSSAITRIENLRAALEDQQVETAKSRAAAQRADERLAFLEEAERQRERQRFVLVWLGMLAVVGASIIFGLTFVGTSRRLELAALAGGVLGWISLTERAGRQSVSVRGWLPFAVFERFRIWVYGPLLAGALGNAVWDGVKYIWND